MKESIDETEEDDEDDRDDNDGDDNDNDVSDVSEIELLDSAVRTFINLVSWGCFFMVVSRSTSTQPNKGPDTRSLDTGTDIATLTL